MANIKTIYPRRGKNSDKLIRTKKDYSMAVKWFNDPTLRAEERTTLAKEMLDYESNCALDVKGKE